MSIYRHGPENFFAAITHSNEEIITGGDFQPEICYIYIASALQSGTGCTGISGKSAALFVL